MSYFRHYKGNYYRFLSFAKHSETLEELVVYQAMYGEKGIWVRPRPMFEESVTLSDGSVVRRFTPCSEEEALKATKNSEDIADNLAASLSVEFKEKGFVAEDFAGGCSLCGEENEFILDRIFDKTKEIAPDLNDTQREALTKTVYIKIQGRL